MTVTAQVRDISKKVYATGTIEGIEQVNVGAQVSGQILKLYVQTGDDVKKGQLLCEIDPKIQETALKTAKAQIAIIEAKTKSQKAQIKKLKFELDRQNQLIKTNATSRQELELAQANYVMAVSSLEELNAQKEQALKQNIIAEFMRFNPCSNIGENLPHLLTALCMQLLSQKVKL